MRYRTPPCCLPVGVTPSAPRIPVFGAQYPACIYPCPTLQVQPRDCPRMARGQDGSLRLSCMTLTFTAPRRFIPTLSAPEWVLATHSADQFANLFWHLRTAALSVPDLPGPEPSEASPVPCDHGFWLDNHEGASPVAPHLRQPGPEDSIGVGQLWPLRRAMQNDDLMTESDDLKLEGGTAAERPQY